VTDQPCNPGEPVGRRIIVGLTGGIACYKIAYLVSRLVQEGDAVTVAMTEAATRFVTPLTFQALSGNPVYTNQWEHVESKDPQHIATARRADAMIIAPSSMDMLAKLAIGRTDDVVSLLVSAIDRAKQPVLLAPSMNAAMYGQPSTQRNLEQLRADGFHIIEPASGWQACRTEGVGRLPEPEALFEEINRVLNARHQSH
jgi:phosphopantothenoylcysteine decarboxylase/phosphopantothenate--cysteine ligase